MRAGAPLAAALLASALPGCPAAGAAGPPEPDTVTIIGIAPLAGSTAQPEQVAGPPSQVATSQDLDRSQAADLTSFMNRRLAGVHLNEIQGNPFQPDVNYRGFSASPLLGSAAGLSVYVDGVRLNQPFGDIVSWDLIPRAAIRSITLAPGSNPLYGLNALGGALAINTKSGLTDPGSGLRVQLGSYGRRVLEAEHGGSRPDGLNWFITGSLFDEGGWRDTSPTRVRQLLAKLGRHTAGRDLALMLAFADTALTGNGLQDARLLASRYSSIYSTPDETDSRTLLANLTLRQALADDGLLAGNLYYRGIRTATVNGDVNVSSLDQPLYQPTATELAALAAAGYSGVPAGGASAANTPYPSWRCIANVLLDAAPEDLCNGLLSRTATHQQTLGFGLQLSRPLVVAGQAQRLVAGVAWEGSDTRFNQSSQFGYLGANRGVTVVAGPGSFADGTQSSPDAVDARVDLESATRAWSLFASDTLGLGRALSLTASGRYNRSELRDQDRLRPPAGPGSLTADYAFGRLNLAFGLDLHPAPSWNAYASYAEGSRAPTAIELGCADPANPCRLPNSMAGDPPLAQVVTRTLEAGFRGRLGHAAQWNAGAFRAESADDILFVAASSGSGYFRNFGRTRRQGLELGLTGRGARLHGAVDLTWLDATYRTAETLPGASNSSSDAPAPGLTGNIRIRPGDRIPLIPQYLLKANAGFELAGKLSVDADLIAVGRSLARGNENGSQVPDGVYYLGSGASPGYLTLNLSGEYRPNAHLAWYLQVVNAADRRYSSAAALGPAALTAAGRFIAEPFATPVIDGERPLVHATFLAPGAPRTVYVGFRLGVVSSRESARD